VIYHDLPVSRDVTLAFDYRPSDPCKRALFYFITEQWERYEAFDFDQRFLQAAYEAADHDLRKRITEHAKQAGRVEWIEIVSDRRKHQRLLELTEEEWETALTVLEHNQQWVEMWQLAQAAPVLWSVKLLHMLRMVEWTPTNPFEQAGFIKLSLLAEGCAGKMPEVCGLMHNQAMPGKGTPRPVRSLAASPDGCLLASGNLDGTIVLWRLPEAAPLKTLEGHSAPVNCLAMSSNGELLASWSLDGYLRLWRLSDGATLKKFRNSDWNVNCLALSSDGHLLAAGNSDNSVQLWQLRGETTLRILKGHRGLVDCLAISPDGRLLASGSWDDTVRLWELPEGKAFRVLKGHTGLVDCLAISPDGRILASGSNDNTVRVWILPDGTLLKTLGGYAEWIQSLAMSPEGRLLASWRDDDTVRMWRVEPSLLKQVSTRQPGLESMIWGHTSLHNRKVTEKERNWIEFTLALMRWQRRFDIEIGETPSINIGKFDIELGKLIER
jgi:WD40 repeat protein